MLPGLAFLESAGMSREKKPLMKGCLWVFTPVLVPQITTNARDDVHSTSQHAVAKNSYSSLNIQENLQGNGRKASLQIRRYAC